MNPPGLPENFDPANYAQKSARLTDERSADLGIHCWHCYERPDGGWDCFEVDCPVSWPPPARVKVE